jgi:hypothetical protein
MLAQRWLIVPGCLLLIAAEPGAPPWRTGYAEAQREARAADKPLFVVFRCEH